MRNVFILAIFTILSAGCFAAVPKNSSDNDVLCYYPCSVEVSGILMTEQRWGAPNFGENPKKDSKILIYVLKLENPVRIEIAPSFGDDSNTEILQDINEIQINFPVKSVFKQLVGQRITVKGQLIEGITPSQYTKIVIIAESVN